jgi:hypothetical protein
MNILPNPGCSKTFVLDPTTDLAEEALGSREPEAVDSGIKLP